MKEQEKEINGVAYIVKQLDALRALKVQAKLIKLLGPALAGIKDAKLTKESIRAKLLDVLSSLVESADDAAVVDLITSLFEVNVFYKHDGQLVKVAFEMHFTGKVMEMWQVAWFVLEVNFGGVLGKLKSSSPIISGLADLKTEL